MMRSILALVALMGLLTNFMLLAMVDLYAGMFSWMLVARLFGFGLAEPNLSEGASRLVGDPGAFLPTIATTLLEGVFLATVMILMAVPVVLIASSFVRLKIARSNASPEPLPEFVGSGGRCAGRSEKNGTNAKGRDHSNI
jgi:hypothetical protein